LNFDDPLAQVVSTISALLVGVQQAIARGGGARQRSLASRLRFCAVAVSNTSSLTPFKPRSRSRSSLRIRFIWANRISTFLRSRRDCWKASVLGKQSNSFAVCVDAGTDGIGKHISRAWQRPPTTSSSGCVQIRSYLEPLRQVTCAGGRQRHLPYHRQRNKALRRCSNPTHKHKHKHKRSSVKEGTPLV